MYADVDGDGPYLSYIKVSGLLQRKMFMLYLIIADTYNEYYWYNSSGSVLDARVSSFALQ